MNEHIRQLAIKSELISLESGVFDTTRLTKQQQRFAELIVKECAEVAGCNGHISGFALGDLIKQHFGVE